VELDVRMMTRLLSRRADSVDEGERLGEILELEYTLERAVPFDPSGRGVVHVEPKCLSMTKKE
jgi:hypothetical protein